MRARQLRRVDRRLIDQRGFLAEPVPEARDIFLDRARKQSGFLGHEADMFGKPFGIPISLIGTVKPDQAAVRNDRPGERAHQRRFPGAARPDDPDDLSRCDPETDIGQDWTPRGVEDREILSLQPALADVAAGSMRYWAESRRTGRTASYRHCEPE